MSFSFDLTTSEPSALAVARVRNMLSDVGDGSPGGGIAGTDYFLSDERIILFLDDAQEVGLGAADVARLAAAAALDALATNEAYVQKVQRLPGLETDGARTALAIRGHAAALRAQVQAARDRRAGGAAEHRTFAVLLQRGPVE